MSAMIVQNEFVFFCQLAIDRQTRLCYNTVGKYTDITKEYKCHNQNGQITRVRAVLTTARYLPLAARGSGAARQQQTVPAALSMDAGAAYGNDGAFARGLADRARYADAPHCFTPNCGGANHSSPGVPF
ncbi:MAG TPA: hypothetical protein H9668_01735 [Firmicutes bacterium]|nr:hypothetical protein [Bacillota bacterium]